MKKKILLVRLDKIGDLICTLCVDQAEFLKDYDVQWVISQGLGFIPDHAHPQRAYLELSKSEWKTSLKSLQIFLREFKPDVAVSFQAPWWVSYALWSCKVPVRGGVLSQWHSFLFLNKGLRQKRSQAIQHEAEYNMDVLRFALDLASNQEAAPVLKLQAPRIPGLNEKHHLVSKNYIVVHPGMAGSALNWPIKYYIQLISELSQSIQIVLTGTPADEPWLKDIKEHFKHRPEVLCLQGKLSSKELLAILGNAKAVVVPSTGVAHIAASLGAPVLGIYSPLRVQHPRRWAARGEHVEIFVPQNKDPDTAEASAMEEILPEQLLKSLSVL